MGIMLDVTKFDVIMFISRFPLNNNFQNVMTYMEPLCFDSIDFELCLLILYYRQDIEDEWTGEIYWQMFFKILVSAQISKSSH